MTLDLTKAAIEDLREIGDYTARIWGERQRVTYLENLWAKFQRILEAPELCRRRDDLFSGCRIAAEGKHVILFRVEGEILQIVRVLHSAMDFRRHVPPDQ